MARAATREARDLAEPGANLAVAGREGLSLYLVDEAVEQEAGADEGEGEEDRDGHRLRAADPHHRRRRTDALLPRWAAHPRRRSRAARRHQQRPHGDGTRDGRPRRPRARG